MASRQTLRSRSPRSLWSKGRELQFFNAADPSDRSAVYIRLGTGGSQLHLSHGWHHGVLEEVFSPELCSTDCPETWPLVVPRPPALFVSSWGEPVHCARRIPPWRIREPSSALPLLSIVFVRWAGEQEVTSGCESDGWGKYGSPISETYLSALIAKGVFSHPKLGGMDAFDICGCDVEIFSIFVRRSQDLWDVTPFASVVASTLKGYRRACFWMLWPVEWNDPDHEKLLQPAVPPKGARTPPFFWKTSRDYAGYVERRALFCAMRACEAAGLRSGFPHCADIYELLTSKSWLASLCLQPEARLPAAVMVSKGSVLQDSKRAARLALDALDNIRKRSPFPVSAGETPAPSVVNSEGVKKGVVKLGWSWEAHYVLCFTGEQELEACLLEMMTYEDCTATSCIVQEWVDFDFEMRWYFILPKSFSSGEKLQPMRSEYTLWTHWGEAEGPHTPSPENGVSMRNSSQKECLSCWNEDAEAWKAARIAASHVSQHLLTWLLAMDSQPIFMIRLDFMLHRWAPGKARVVFGEFCEAGACCLSWEEGPEVIWRAALDAALA